MKFTSLALLIVTGARVALGASPTPCIAVGSDCGGLLGSTDPCCNGLPCKGAFIIFPGTCPPSPSPSSTSTTAAPTPTCGSAGKSCGYFDRPVKPCCAGLTCQDRNHLDGGGTCAVPSATSTTSASPTPTPTCVSTGNECGTIGQDLNCCAGLECQDRDIIIYSGTCGLPTSTTSTSPTPTPTTPPPTCLALGNSCAGRGNGQPCCKGLKCFNREGIARACRTCRTLGQQCDAGANMCCDGVRCKGGKCVPPSR